MSEYEPINVNWWDVETDEELEGIQFPQLQTRPLIGDEVHYWQDGFGSAVGADSRMRLDLVVTRVQHDLRYMPAGGRPKYIHSLNIWVRKATP